MAAPRSRSLAVVWALSIVGTGTPVWCQSSWANYPNNASIAITSNGNVGIGTSTPAFPLDVAGQGRFAGQAMIGGTSNWATFGYSAYYDGSWHGSGMQMSFNGNVMALGSVVNGASSTVALFDNRNYNAYLGYNGGKVGIGTVNPAHKLHVAGTIGAQEVIVSSTGADYVFDPAYRLTPLSEVAAYIQKHRHLPDIPPASDAQAKGVSVGDFQTKLLAKIEELTLHMIQAAERNERLEKQNQDLRDRLTRLETAAAR